MGPAQGSFLGSLECLGLTFLKKGSNSYSYVNISSLAYHHLGLRWWLRGVPLWQGKTVEVLTWRRW